MAVFQPKIEDQNMVIIKSDIGSATAIKKHCLLSHCGHHGTDGPAVYRLLFHGVHGVYERLHEPVYLCSETRRRKTETG